MGKLTASADMIVEHILVVRGQRVMIDYDLARLYKVPTKALNQAVKRNAARFPSDFMFQLNAKEIGIGENRMSCPSPPTPPD
ncbi:MAG: ORF6N domain-containing protein, partial [Candidatus Omnitrophota bacterium]